MEIAIAKLEYLLKAAKTSLKAYKKEQYELNKMFCLDDDEIAEGEEQVIDGYLAEIKSYEKALNVLKGTKDNKHTCINDTHNNQKVYINLYGNTLKNWYYSGPAGDFSTIQVETVEGPTYRYNCVDNYQY